MRVPPFASLFALALVAALAAAPAWAASETVLYSFTRGADGGAPRGGLVADAAGALYGVAEDGGSAQLGVVFKLTPPTAGRKNWTETVLYSFQGLSAGGDGARPQTGLLMDASGALYGTTFSGGNLNNGTVFMLTPPAGGSGAWRETILHSFCNNSGGCPDGEFPVGLTFGHDGELYGVTEFGGPLRGGVVFRLTPPAGRTSWTETVLAALPAITQPKAGLLLGPGGALYGTTSQVGAYGHGSVFKVTPPAAGKDQWTLTTVWSFGKTLADGRLPLSLLTRGPDGSLYGTTALGGGKNNSGVVFRLTPPAGAGGQWQETILHRFHQADGAHPFAGVTFDATGALYGAAVDGGAADLGSVYKLTPLSGDGLWPERVLHTFQAGIDAANPLDTLLPLPSGAYVGTANAGGKFGQGAIYQVVP
jgi:uncharacterized repeat protein (TIGR03803 family)